MSSPQSFMAPLPQGNWGAPLLNFGQLAQYPELYAQGQARRAFPNGLPGIQTGDPNADAIIQTGLKTYGLNFATQILPYLQKQQWLQDDSTGPVSSVGANATDQAGSPAAITGGQPTTGRGTVQVIAGKGTEDNPYVISNQGAYNFFQQSERYPNGSHWTTPGGVGGIKGQPNSITRKTTPASPIAQPTSVPDQSQEASGQQVGGGGSSQTPDGAPAPTTAPTTGRSLGQWPRDFAFAPRAGTPEAKQAQAGPITTPGGPRPSPEDQAVPRAPPTIGRGGAAVPAPGVVPAAAPTEAQARTPANPTMRTPTPTADGIVPPAYRGRALQYAQEQDALAAHLMQRAQRGEVIGVNTKGMLDEAAAARARATQVREALTKDLSPTEPTKTAQEGGYASASEQKAAEQLKTDQIKLSNQKWIGIDAAGSQYERHQVQYINLATSVLNDPRVYTGIGVAASLDSNKLRSIYGDGTAAMLQIALQKITARDILGQIMQQKNSIAEAGENSSRIFSSQMDLMAKASASLDNTVGANRLLIEVERRAGELDVKVRDEARAYRAAHGGILDDGFDEHMQKYLAEHPIFSQQELANPAMLGAPTVPKEISGNHQRELQWATQMQLTGKDPVREIGPGGVVRYVRLRELKAQ